MKCKCKGLEPNSIDLRCKNNFNINKKINILRIENTSINCIAYRGLWDRWGELRNIFKW